MGHPRGWQVINSHHDALLLPRKSNRCSHCLLLHHSHHHHHLFLSSQDRHLYLRPLPALGTHRQHEFGLRARTAHSIKTHVTNHTNANHDLQVFGLLMFEMSVFMALIVPLPFDWKRKLFEFISHSPIVAKLQYGMKVSPPTRHTPRALPLYQTLTSELQITFIFILILFIDSVNRVYRVQMELSMSKNQGGAAA